jgi:hypothetical protein
MKRLNLSLIVLAMVVVGVGFYQGWFALSSSRQAESQKVDVHLTVDPEKVKEDAEKVKDKTKELTGKATEGAKDLGDRARDKVKSD